MSALYASVGAVAFTRLAELVYADRNTRRLLARGGVEIAAFQYPFFIVLHAAWLVGMLIFIPASRLPNWYLIGAFIACFALRIWAIATLGPWWTTRIITLPGAPLVRRGPYRFLPHPNYVAVAGEIATLPLAFGALGLAALFTALNAALLAWRIRIEDRALDPRRKEAPR